MFPVSHRKGDDLTRAGSSHPRRTFFEKQALFAQSFINPLKNLLIQSIPDQGFLKPPEGGKTVPKAFGIDPDQARQMLETQPVDQLIFELGIAQTKEMLQKNGLDHP